MEFYKKIVDSNNAEVNLYVQEVIDILQKWFNKLQDGTHVLAVPDPFSKVTQVYADKLVEVLDDDINEKEFWRLGGINGYQEMPEFIRLCPKARLAMAQEVQKVLKYQEGHLNDYLCTCYDVLNKTNVVSKNGKTSSL